MSFEDDEGGEDADIVDEVATADRCPVDLSPKKLIADSTGVAICKKDY